MRALFLSLTLIVLSSLAAAETLIVHSPGDGFLNLRQGPATSYRIIMKMKHGSRVGVMQRIGKWVKVRHISGRIGWAHSKYLVAQNASRTTQSFFNSGVGEIKTAACQSQYRKYLRYVHDVKTGHKNCLPIYTLSSRGDECTATCYRAGTNLASAQRTEINYCEVEYGKKVADCYIYAKIRQKDATTEEALGAVLFGLALGAGAGLLIDGGGESDFQCKVYCRAAKEFYTDVKTKARSAAAAEKGLGKRVRTICDGFDADPLWGREPRCKKAP